MRIIAKSTLRRFWKRYPDAKGSLEAWHDEVCIARWVSPRDIRDDYATASFCGNKYRLVVEVQYAAGIVWVKFIGTHARYDKIDVATVNEY